MFGSTIAKVLAGVALAAILACGTLGWRYDAALTREASAKAALSTALTANASLIAARDRARAEADAERDRAIARQHERDAMAGQLVELRRVLGDGAAGCAWTPEKARAVDEFLGGDVK